MSCFHRMVLLPSRHSSTVHSRTGYMMRRTRESDWQAPCRMLVSPCSGFAIALIHHLFHQGLAERQARDDEYSMGGLRYNRQQANIAIGTFLAFLVKTSTVLTVTIAYRQRFWTYARSSSRRQGIAMSHLDAITSATTNMFSPCHLSSFRKQPLLLLLAFTAW